MEGMGREWTRAKADAFRVLSVTLLIHMCSVIHSYQNHLKNLNENITSLARPEPAKPGPLEVGVQDAALFNMLPHPSDSEFRWV